MLIGAIADDLTGAGDLSLMLARSGMKTLQIMGIPAADINLGAAQAVVVALKSRNLPAAEAVAQTLAAAQLLLDAGAKQIFFKYCSTFDSTDQGNIGPVIEALLQLLGERRTIACPAFPATGRRLYRGHLFVGDQLLSDSDMKDHPLTPMHDANLVRLLQRQTTLPVSLIPHEVVTDITALEAAIEELTGIALVDALSDGDLHNIGRAARNLRLITGGSGIALGLPANFLTQGHSDDNMSSPSSVTIAPLNIASGQTVMLAGSCSAATREQVATAIVAGMPSLSIDAMKLADGHVDLADVVDFACGCFNGLPALIYSSADPATVQGIHRRLGHERAGEMIEKFFAQLACQLARRGVNRFIIAGGETSGSVVNSLDIAALTIGQEIAAGVAWAGTSDGAFAFALKSGHFGGKDFFLKAWALRP